MSVGLPISHYKTPYQSLKGYFLRDLHALGYNRHLSFEVGVELINMCAQSSVNILYSLP